MIYELLLELLPAPGDNNKLTVNSKGTKTRLCKASLL